MSIKHELQSVLRELEHDLAPDPSAGLHAPRFTWAGKEWPCAPSTIRRGSTLEIGGFNITFELSLHVRKNAVSTTDNHTVFSSVTQPSSGDKVTYNTVTYRVLNVDNLHEGALTLILGNPDE